jgi:hypothetical protein
MTPYEIPLSPEPQRFSITLVDKLYQMRVLWNKDQQCWHLDINDEVGVPLLLGVPLVPGYDLLRQYRHLDFGGALIVQADYDIYATPTFEDLGITARLYFVTGP